MTNTKGNVVGTSRGKPVTEADVERMVAEAEAGYDIAKLRPRGGRPSMCSVEVYGNSDGGIEPSEHRCARAGRSWGVKRASNTGHRRSLAVTGGRRKRSLARDDSP